MATIGDLRARGVEVEKLKPSDISVLIEIYDDNSKQIAEAVGQAAVKALESIGLLGERFAKDYCPVDTGRLRNSITFHLDTDGRLVRVGTNVDYAEAVELNDRAKHKVGRAHYLRDAGNLHKSEYEEAARNAFMDADVAL